MNKEETARLVRHIRNLIISDPTVIAWMGEVTAETEEDKKVLKMIRQSQLILLMAAVMGDFGATNN